MVLTTQDFFFFLFGVLHPPQNDGKHKLVFSVFLQGHREAETTALQIRIMESQNGLHWKGTSKVI